MGELAARVGGKPVLIASADQFVSAIALHEAQLREHYRLSPGVKLQGRLATKETQYALAVDYGMPLPRTQRVSTLQEATAFASAAAFPCLMKPLHFREWHAFEEGHALSHQKVSIAATPPQDGDEGGDEDNGKGKGKGKNEDKGRGNDSGDEGDD
jgi:predicted ATP-grasp superfamily ATP-dependent carboligase